MPLVHGNGMSFFGDSRGLQYIQTLKSYRCLEPHARDRSLGRFLPDQKCYQEVFPMYCGRLSCWRKGHIIPIIPGRIADTATYISEIDSDFSFSRLNDISPINIPPAASQISSCCTTSLRQLLAHPICRPISSQAAAKVRRTNQDDSPSKQTNMRFNERCEV